MLSRTAHHQPEPTDQDVAIIEVLTRFFGAANGIVGHEANYQILLAMKLEDAFPGRVRRELRTLSTGRGGIDVAVLDSNDRLWAVFEVKGGAYNTRSALRDEFRTGIPKDTAALAQVQIPSSRRWIVAVDAVGEFGRSLSQSRQQRINDDANAQGVSFAYHGQGDETCTIAVAGGRLQYPGVLGSVRSGSRLDAGRPFSLAALSPVLAEQRGSLDREADVVSAVYGHLLSQGYSAQQVATEAYFGFAPKQGRMHERPDLCLFNPAVQGHFNLYRQGDTSRTYDALKFANLRTVVEVKGGAVLAKARDPSLMKSYGKDIDKLATWRRLVERQPFPRDPQLPPVEFVFVGADLRERPLDPTLADRLSRQATRQGVRFIYVHLPDTHGGTGHAV
jgi:hypothetical protein